MGKKREGWICDFCHKKKDTLYFKGKKQICGDCRRKEDKEAEKI